VSSLSTKVSLDICNAGSDGGRVVKQPHHLQRRAKWCPGDRDRNEALAIDILDSAHMDSVCIALALVGWKLIPAEGRRRRWALHGPVPAGMAPEWTVSVREQEAEIAEALTAVNPSRPGPPATISKRLGSNA
jgi:hypothetical protein